MTEDRWVIEWADDDGKWKLSTAMNYHPGGRDKYQWLSLDTCIERMEYNNNRYRFRNLDTGETLLWEVLREVL